MLNQSETVNQFLSKIEHPMKDEIEKVRSIILGSNQQITEHIKWNAPSFCYQGEDRMTFNLHARGRVQLIFHRGAKSKDSRSIKLDDKTGLIEWIAGDRAKVEFTSMEDVEAKKSELASIVNQWIERSA